MRLLRHKAHVQYFYRLLLLAIVLLLACPCEAQYQFDLGSSDKSIPASSLLNGAQDSATISINGTQTTVSKNDKLTPSEFIALSQALGGSQTIQLNSNGTANGGTFTVNPQFASLASALAVPAGVTVLQDFAALPVINLSGTLNNAGSYYTLSTNPQITSGSIQAANIINQSGAIISSILPTSIANSIPNAISAVNLNLIAQNQLMNMGTISSSGALSVTAGQSITNGTSAATQAIMSATQSLNMVAPQIFNAGTLVSQAGTVNLDVASLVNTGLIQSIQQAVSVRNSAGGNLNLDNTLGGIAGNTAIEFLTRSGSAKAVLSLLGGNLTAPKISFQNDGGHIQINADQLNGAINVSGGTATLRRKRII